MHQINQNKPYHCFQVGLSKTGTCSRCKSAAGPVWAVSLLFLGFIFCFTEWFKRETRRDPQGWVARCIAY